MGMLLAFAFILASLLRLFSISGFIKIIKDRDADTA
jgi:hypothetical protein